jgi:hypothetical protein
MIDYVIDTFKDTNIDINFIIYTSEKQEPEFINNSEFYREIMHFLNENSEKISFNFKEAFFRNEYISLNKIKTY